MKQGGGKGQEVEEEYDDENQDQCQDKDKDAHDHGQVLTHAIENEHERQEMERYYRIGGKVSTKKKAKQGEKARRKIGQNQRCRLIKSFLGTFC